MNRLLLWCVALAGLLAACSSDPPTSPTDASADRPMADGGVMDATVPCRTSVDCVGAVCHPTLRVCVACNAPSDCRGADQTCSANRCVPRVPCTSSRMCPGQVCDLAVGFCVDCVTDPDCSMGLVCRGSVCVTPPRMCRSSRECSDQGQVCHPQRNVCVDCAGDTDCDMTQYCGDDNACRPRACTPNATECAGADRLRSCDARGTRWSDAPCGAGMLCASGRCVTRVCTPGEASCADAMTRAVCNADGLGRAMTPCGAGEVCSAGVCLPRTCTPGSATCANAGTRRLCNPDGSGYTEEPCATMTSCSGGVCRAWSCTPGATRCMDTMVETCNADGQTWAVGPCPAMQSCRGSSCQPWTCTPGTTTCANPSTRRVCNPDGATFTEQPCGAMAACSGGACGAQACTPGATRCMGAMLETCNVGGTAWTAAPCPAMQGCQGGMCRPWVCTPGATTCASDTARGTCSADGFTLAPTPCAMGERCVSGACTRMLCTPGALYCEASGARMLCNADGTAAVPMPCGAGQVCGGAGVCRLIGDACPGLDVTPDGPMVTVVPSGFSTSSEVGVSCGSGGPRAGFVDAVVHFRLSTMRDVLVNVGSGSAVLRMQLQSTCAPTLGAVGPCFSAANPTRRYRGLAAGDYYLVLEYPSGTSPTPFTVQVTTTPPGTRLTGDACVAPFTLIPDGPAVGLATTGFDTVADIGTTCGSNTNGEGWIDWVARFTLTTTRDVTLALTGGWSSFSGGARVALYGACDRTVPVGGCYSIQSSLGRTLRYRALPPGTYFLVGETNLSTASPMGATLTTGDPNARMPGDTCGAAVPVTIDGPAATVLPTTLDSVSDVGTPCGSRGARVDGWYDWVWRFTLAAPGDVQLAFTGVPSSARVQVTSGCGATATPVGPCNTVSSSYTRRYRGLAAGTYHVVMEANSVSSATALTATLLPMTRLPGDTCATAIEVTPDGPQAPLSTTNFDTIADQGALCNNQGPQDGWVDGFWRFRLAAARDATVTFATTPSVAWRLQRGCGASSSAISGCSPTTAPERTRTFRDLAAGDYYIVMAGSAGFTASPTVTTTATTPRQPGDVCATAVVATPDGPAVSVNAAALSTTGDYGVSCGPSLPGSTTGRPDFVFSYTLTTTRDVSLEITPGTASVGYGAEVISSCTADSGAIFCNRALLGTRTLRIPRQAPGTYYLRIEGSASLGITALRVLTSAPGTFPGYTVTRGAISATVDACTLPGVQIYLPNLDDSNTVRVVPFRFLLWGQMVTGNVNISSNGFVNFDGVSTAATGVTIPLPSAPNLVVAPLARDLYTSTRGVCFVTAGVAPNRQMYFQWDAFRYFSGAGTGTVQVVITETTNTIDFNYNQHNNRDTSATVGLENADGTDAVTICPGPDCLAAIATGQSIRFTPR